MENGLEKLRSTACQVDQLKEKLAIQEIELQQKNEAADRLIERVGVETAKVQSEKGLGETDGSFFGLRDIEPSPRGMTPLHKYR